MGRDLRLYPVDGDNAPHIFFAHTMISLTRNAILGDVGDVAKMHGQPLPCEFTTFREAEGSNGYGAIAADPYGAPLKYVLAKHLKPLAKHLGIAVEDVFVRETAWQRIEGDALQPKKKTRAGMVEVNKSDVEDGYQSRVNRAAFAFICALPDDFKIVLYWH